MLPLLAILFLGLPLRAGETLPRPKALRPVSTRQPPVLDGRLDDPVWASAPSVTDFSTFIPDFGRAQPERTVAYAACDTDHLYFAFRCFEPDPSKIKAALTRRDDLAKGDFVCINLDTFDDQQSLFGFYVTPSGVQADSRFASNREDFSVDLVWDSAARIDAEGWSVELRIPLKSLRYSHGWQVRMAVFFERYVARRQEHASSPALDPARGYAFLPQMMPLVYEGLARPVILELLPSFTATRREVREQGVLVRQPDQRELGLTAKVGLTPSLILDATVNPDFSQVEADAGQVDANLRHGLFYAEKRPFFLEGSEVFNLAATGGPLASALHTRTLVDPTWGAKLSGKVGRQDMIALMAVRDAGPPPESGQPSPDPAQVAVARYRHTLWEDGYLGLLAMDHRQGPRDNRVFGPDGQVRLGPADLLSFHALGSFTDVDGASGTRRGRALGAEWLHDTSRLSVKASVYELSRGFQADNAFLTRTGLAAGTLRVTPKFYPAGGLFRRLDPWVSLEGLRDAPSGLWEQDLATGVTAILRADASLSLTLREATEVFAGQRFRTDGVSLSAQGQVTSFLRLQASARRGRGLWYDPVAPAQGEGNQASLTAILQPTEGVNLTLGWVHADLHREDSGLRLYDVDITRAKFTWQVNHLIAFRAIAEYHDTRRQLLTDFLAAFTPSPGTVVYLGYGDLSRKVAWEQGVQRDSDHFQVQQRGLFFKASYLWRY